MSLKEKFKSKFIDYIYKLPINQVYKESICDEGFINDNPDFYLYYPYLFNGCFQVSESEMDKLSIAGYLYYQSTLYMDNLIDENDKTKIGLISVCQEETVKILSSIFPTKSVFWEYWNKRKDEYFYAVNYEKDLNKKESVNFEDYQKLSDFKAAFGKIAIDSLFTLDKNTKSQKCLLESHKHFSIAYQLNDDVLDFEKDFENNQFNWLIYKYTKKYDLKEYSINDLKKLLYINGNINQTFKKAISHIDKALNSVSEINVSFWKEHLIKMKLKFSSSITEIENYLKLLKIEVELSNTVINDNTIENSLKQAIKFIKSKQHKNGVWEDYINQGGISNIWSTAFITSKLSSSNELRKIFKKNIEKSLLFLSESQIKNGLWGYNTTWIEDSDTTNFVLVSLLLNQKLGKESSLLDNWEKYKTHQKLFTTYANQKYLLKSLSDDNIKNVDGWVNSHLCVSSVALYFLSKLGIESKTFMELKKYFDILPVEKVNAYWWTDNIYTLYYLALSYDVQNEEQKLNEIQKIIANKINEQGYEDMYGANMFYTGLALEILLLKKHTIYISEINKIISHILNNQFLDGSWNSSHSLKIPNPNNIDTQTVMLPISTHGTNVRAKEFNRLFTTSSILKSLQLWSEVS